MGKTWIPAGLLAVMIFGNSAGFAETMAEYSERVRYNRYYSSPWDDREVRQDVSVLFKGSKQERIVSDSVKKLPADDPRQIRLEKKMEAIGSTNFVANPKSMKIQIVPGLASKKKETE
ncbi:MAG: hypothetical protein FJ220_00805 [Kiritimatiellaceae bacterium]|nr:hypothetical protein [Kiritimatiellaceae bacterium]